MIDIYSSWVKGLDTDQEALKIIKDSGILSGLEVWGLDLAENTRKGGLKVSIHNPTKALKLDLADEKMVEELQKRENQFIFDGIAASDSLTVGFHLYFKPNPIIYYLLKKRSIRREDIKILEEEGLKENIIRNLAFLHDRINEERKMNISFESYPYSEAKEINRYGQELFPEFQKVLDVSGKMSSVEFISSVLEDKGLKRRGVGFLFDIVHVLVAAETRSRRGETDDSAEEYVDRIILASAGRVHEMHINSPLKAGNSVADLHGELVKGEPLSEQVLRIAKKVLKHNPQLSVITLEVDTELSPVEHARKLVEQARLIAKELKIR